MRKSLRFARCVEFAAWSLGLACASTLMYDRVEALSAQRAADVIVEHAAGSHRVTLTPTAFGPAPEMRTAGMPTSKVKPVGDRQQLLGTLDIPALHLSTPIIDDVDDESLTMGAGHVRGTAMPGGLGNFVVAAHRDTYFRPLAGIQAGMTMEVKTADGTYTYIVESTKIVLPEDVDVLDMGDVPQMTLITCYPFHYIGSAPKRFVVQARLQGF